jgi:hypothetical protein
MPIRNSQSPVIPGLDVPHQVRQLAKCTLTRALMCHLPVFSFQLHDNALELHKYTRYQKMKASHGEGEGFDGELDNFQEPVLSSLAKLVCVDHTMMWPAADGISCLGYGRSSKTVIHARGALRHLDARYAYLYLGTREHVLFMELIAHRLDTALTTVT